MNAVPSPDIQLLDSRFDAWQELLDLILLSFSYMNGVIDPPSSALLLTTDTLRDKAEAETVLLASIGPRLAGCAFLAEKDDHFYLGKLAIAPDAQGQNIGKALLKAAEAVARDAGKPVLELQTRIELTANHRIFERFGFQKVRETAHPGFDRTTSITMRKAITHDA